MLISRGKLFVMVFLILVKPLGLQSLEWGCNEEACFGWSFQRGP